MVEHWIIPCNIKYFDIEEHFKTQNDVIFRRVSAIFKDDIAYIYLTAPYSEIKYKCIVVDDDVPQYEVEENSYAIPKKKIDNKKMRYLKLRLKKTFDNKSMPLCELKKHGLGQVQVQARTDRKVQAYIDIFDK